MRLTFYNGTFRTFLRFLTHPILHLFEIFCKHCVLGMVAAGCLPAVAGSGLARFPWPWETNGRGGRNGRTAAEEDRGRPRVREW